ncbi:hypothetical protein AAIH68_35205, partial [Pseudomonas aeruginosa]|uniref:hypothetical protein n=2 Tax=Gammaproteobacteria TaxID=1236 RepID=UPI0031B6FA89
HFSTICKAFLHQPTKKISTLAIETVLNLKTEKTNKKFQTSHNKKHNNNTRCKNFKTRSINQLKQLCF